MTSQAGKPGETGADALCDTLLANDVDVCFANPGTSEMHFVAALDRKQQMRCVLGLFEGVVTGAADGYARMAAKPAATLLDTGPGLANALANMHNARRAHTPMVNVVGDHASYHLPYDAPLTSDIESLARPMSGFVRRIGSAADVSPATAEAIAAASRAPGAVTTLILPADHAWGAAPQVAPAKAQLRAPALPDPDRVAAVAKALKNGKKTVIVMSGTALRAGALATAQGIADATGAALMAQQSNGRMERGAGRVAVDRVPYPVDQAIAALRGFEQIVLVGAKWPVIFFGYPGKPSSPVPEGCETFVLADPSDDLPAALEALGSEVGAGTAKPVAAALPDAATGALNAETLAVAIGRHLPENAIVCDEAVTTGRDFFRFTAGSAAHDWLQVTGGAIGGGMPLATGAAIACPGRKVVNLQADGSAMYTNQALWTMAREKLDICVVIFANRKYQILLGELKGVGAGEPGLNASRMLNLDDPSIDFVKLAESMGVEAARADTAEGFADLFARAMKTEGPFLIEAVI